jgi:FAD-linked sulfhydryl oxidase
MTSRTNYYKTVTQIFHFDEHQDDKQAVLKLPDTPKKETFYVDADDDEDYATQGNLPEVFGPPLWFCLHNAAHHYPENAAPTYAERMKGIIIGLPVLIPCTTCKEHATAYIEEKKHTLMEVCKSRKTLVIFFIDFHNYVNQRLGKKIYSYEEAEALYQ